MKERKFGVKTITRAASIAALYVVLTQLSGVLGLAGNNPVQLRISEALTVLPAFTGTAIPGLLIGCLLSNWFLEGIALDVALGSLATLIGAVCTYKFCRKKYLAPLPPIISNTLIVPFVLKYGYGAMLPIPLLMMYVAIGEILSCGVLGVVLYSFAEKHKNELFE